MLRCVPRMASSGLMIAWLTMAMPAFGQFYTPVSNPVGGFTPTSFSPAGFGGGNCCPCPTAAAPMPLTTVSAPVSTVSCQPQVTMQCQPLVAVPQTQYRQVAVTEYQPKKVTVQRPVVETRYVEQPVTAYRPITEARTVEVPQVNYQPVTEYRTVQRDMGRWVTQRQCINRPSPCEYDGRPGFAGWWNRTAYNVRSSFTPSYRTVRHYQPNVVAQVVPQTRMVAQQCTKQVTYNVTRYEPYQTTRKVAVNSVRMVAEEVTQMEPVTVMKTIPTGTTIAWVSPSQLGTATALAPENDPNASRSATNTRETVVPPRSADARGDVYRRTDTTSPAAPAKKPFAGDKQPFSTDASFPPTGSLERNESIQPASLRMPTVERRYEEPAAPRAHPGDSISAPAPAPTTPDFGPAGITAPNFGPGGIAAPDGFAPRNTPPTTFSTNRPFTANRVPTAARVANWQRPVRPLHTDPALAPLTVTAGLQ